MLPITLKDMRGQAEELRFRLAKRYSRRLERRLYNLEIKIERKSAICAKFYSTPSNIRTEW